MNTIWPKVKLGEVLQQRKEFIVIDDLTTYKRPRVQLHVQGIVLRDEVPGALIKTKQQQVCRAGELLVAEIDAKVGGFGIVPESLDGAIVSSHYFLFVLNEQILDRRFLGWYIRTPEFRDQVEAQGSTNYAAIRPSDVSSYRILLPPLTEQRRIVARIDQLAVKIAEARSLRQKANEEAEALWAMFRHYVFTSVASHDCSLMQLDAVAPINMGQSPEGNSYNNIGKGVPLVNGPTEFGELHPTPVQWTTAPTKLCKENDILLCVRGATTGRMNWANREYCIGRGLAALSPNPDICLSEYVYHFVATQTRELLARSAGSTFPNLPGAKLKSLKIPVPSLQVQRRIVAELEAVQAQVDTLKRRQSETSSEVSGLIPSILDKAFKGEL